MRKATLVFFVYLLVACEGQYTTDSEALNYFSAEDYIVGGERASSTSVISQIIVGIRGSKTEEDGQTFVRTCTGAFVSENVILTAAHCFDDKEMNYKIIYSVDLGAQVAQTSQIEKVLIHSQYDPVALNIANEDLALVKIRGKRPMQMRTVALKKETIEGAFGFVASGYGAVHGIKNSKVEQEAGVLRIVPLVSRGMKAETNYFVVDQKSGQGICSGDSGGPAIRFENQQPYLLGVASAIFYNSPTANSEAKEFDTCKESSAYLSAPYYHRWITKGIERLSAIKQ